MSSVIVFSKDRPMQLHAYIESLLRYSDIEQKDITVLYKKSADINYSRVLKEYQLVNYIDENNFYENLIQIISNSKDYIMFGCDDVVFNNHFSTKFAEEILSLNSQIFGFSFRLGKNITPFPNNHITHQKYIEWNWKDVTEIHYNYPWELCATLYRKSDIVEMMKMQNNKIISPNYFESTFATDASKYILRPNLACQNQNGNAIAITVNRVQDTHCNPVDNTMPTDIYSLDKIYNQRNNKLDIGAIAKIKNNAIHVGSEYFILKNKEKNWNKPKIKKDKSKRTNPLKLFIKNIGYLFRLNLKKIAKDQSNYITIETLNLILKDVHESIHNAQNSKNPHIKSPEETIDDLINKKPSFCRYGDGEFILIEGGDIPFQKYNPILSKRLREILRINDENIFVGVPYFYFSFVKNLRDVVSNFVYSWVYKNKAFIGSLCLPDKQYYDTACSQMYACYEKMDFDSYFKKVKEIWLNRDIAIICGKTVFDKIETNIFDCAKSVEYQYAPAINAFDEYDKILARAQKIDKNKLIIIILGPTATVLAYDLAKQGYQAIDFGHIAKDYDFFCKKINHSEASINDFFKPD